MRSLHGPLFAPLCFMAGLIGSGCDDSEPGLGSVDAARPARDARVDPIDASVPDARDASRPRPDARPDADFPDAEADAGSPDADAGAADVDSGPPPCGESPEPGSVIFVDASAPGGGDGASWLTAYSDLQDALSSASSGQQVWVAGGTYRPVTPANSTSVTISERSASFIIPDGVAVFGGFEGDEALECDRAQADRLTILDGDLLGDDADSDADGYLDDNREDNAFHVVRFGAVGRGTRLDGVRIQRGFANGSGNDRFGGGVLNVGGSPAIVNVELWDHAAPGFFNLGAGLASVGGDVLVEGVDLLRNVAGGNGGAVYLDDADATIIDSSFEGSRGRGSGGAIFQTGDGEVSIRGSTFVSNQVAVDGGGNGNGGAFELDGGRAVISTSRFDGNQADRQGGAIDVRDGDLTVTHCVFENNDGGTRGGAIAVGSFVGDRVVEYSVFVGNVAGRGGAVFTRAQLRLSHVTAVANQAANRGPGTGVGGAFSVADREGPLRVYDSIVWSNVADVSGVSIDQNEASFANSVVEGSGGSPWDGAPPGRGSDGGGVLDVDPGFVSLADPRGPDGVLGTADDGLRLTTASPAVDAAVASDLADTDRDGLRREAVRDVGDVDRDGDVLELLPSDLAGNARRVGRTVDMGAYETPGVPAVTTIWYVNAEATGADNGSSWTDAFDELADAFAAARARDEIWVAAGTYTPGSDRSDSFVLRPGLALYGGFAGTESQRSARDPELNLSILSGNIGADGENDNAYRVLVASGVGVESVVDGFIIEGAFNDNSASNESGGGIFISGGTPTLSNLTIRSNQATNGAGVFLAALAELELRDLRFEGNRGWLGGGVYATGSLLRVTRGTFSANAGGGGGGGIYLDRSRAIVSHSAFFENSATTSASSPGPGGGGIMNTEGGDLSVSQSVFAENEAVHGGAVATFNRGTTRLSQVTLLGNAASRGGALSAWNGATVEASGSTLWGNRFRGTTNEGREIFSGRNGAVGSTVNVAFSVVEGGVGGGNVFACNNCTVADVASNLDSDPDFVNPADPAGPDGELGTADDGVALGGSSGAVDLGTSEDRADLDVDGDLTEVVPDVGDVDGDGDFEEAVPTDVTGGPRVNGGGVDVGAFER